MRKSDTDMTMKLKDRYSSEFVDSPLAYNVCLDVFSPYLNYRGTGIVCTIGPACANSETLKAMIHAGMGIARFNFSHGSHEDHTKMMDLVRKASLMARPDQQIALALDTKGPEIRTGMNKDGATITLDRDELITLTTDDAYMQQCTKDVLYIDYKSLTKSISVGQIILVADGNVVLEALEIKGANVKCRVVSGISFGSRKNVCLPLVAIDLPAMSEKDKTDLLFGVSQNVDIIFASFIRTADNVREIRKLLDSAKPGNTIKIVSKIENHEGVTNIEEIIDESDGIMVARGDLGMDLELEMVIVAQKKIIAMCNLKGKPVICATQMLESMINSSRPTRAEVADVTNAVLDGADCVMLSGESANGKYPIQAVKTMHMICHAAEKIYRTKSLYESIKDSLPVMSESQAVAMAAVSMSYKVRADGIFVLTTTGKTAYLLSMFRPRCLIFCVTRSEEVSRGSHLYRNLYPLLYKKDRNLTWCEDVDSRLKFAVKHAQEKGYVKEGSKMIFITGWKSGAGTSNCIRISTLQSGGILPGLI
ncbi:hypothetical protein HZS_6503 [Henneguya salminicola]|nr:hypothetical protein HZS_6503 [Henneguya salminicola]